MTNDAGEHIAFLTPRKIALQLLGFALGIFLLYLCIRGAITGEHAAEGWDKIRHASPHLIVILLGCTLLSLLINGTSFWITIQSIKPLRWWDMQRLNFTGNLLNYAPIRLGAIARVAYHLRVDRLRLLQITAWFGFIGVFLALAIAACVGVSWLHPEFDLWWMMMILGIMILGGLGARIMVQVPVVQRFGQGLDQIVHDPRALWGTIILRLADLSCYTGRMVAAALILGLDLPLTQIVILAVVALGASLTPLGRVGIREWCVAQAALLLSLNADEAAGRMAQLALVESAGEALIFLPLGVFFLWWYRKAMLKPNPRKPNPRKANPTPPPTP